MILSVKMNMSYNLTLRECRHAISKCSGVIAPESGTHLEYRVPCRVSLGSKGAEKYAKRRVVTIFERGNCVFHL